VSGVDDRFSLAKRQLPHKGTTISSKRAGVVPIGAIRLVTIAVAAHMRDEDRKTLFGKRRCNISPDVSGGEKSVPQYDGISVKVTSRPNSAK
jgi:hypothetical protein